MYSCGILSKSMNESIELTLGRVLLQTEITHNAIKRAGIDEWIQSRHITTTEIRSQTAFINLICGSKPESYDDFCTQLAAWDNKGILVLVLEKEKSEQIDLYQTPNSTAT